MEAGGDGSQGARQVELVVQQVSMQLYPAVGEIEGKYLLRDVSAKADTSGVLAVMGPSGAGKTMLLSVLADAPPEIREGGLCRSYVPHITGDVTLNGEHLTPQLYASQVAFVGQKDQDLHAMLSCYDHVHSAVRLYRGNASAKEATELADAILSASGLASCKTTRAGSEDYPGLSGGQQRRLSVAIALAKTPAMLVCDEPTTGHAAAHRTGDTRLAPPCPHALLCGRPRMVARLSQA